MNVVVLGGSGIVGSELVKRLLNSSQVSRLTLLSRRPLPEISSPKASVVVLDLEETFLSETPATASGTASAKDIVGGHDVPVHCLGTTRADAGSAERFTRIDHDLPIAVLKHHTGKSAVLLSSMGANSSSYLLYPRSKGLLEEAFMAHASLDHLAIFRPGLLLLEEGQERRTPRFWESVGIKAAKMIGLNYGSIPVATVADALLTIASAPMEEPRIKIYENEDIRALGSL